MTLFELLMAMFFALQATVGIGMAKGAHTGLLGYAGTSILGLSVAVFWIVSVYKIFAWCGDRASQEPPTGRSNRLLGFAAAFCLIWEIAGVALAGWLSATLLRHMT